VQGECGKIMMRMPHIKMLFATLFWGTERDERNLCITSCVWHADTDNQRTITNSVEHVSACENDRHHTSMRLSRRPIDDESRGCSLLSH
jgi:hypothetical protein